MKRIRDLLFASRRAPVLVGVVWMVASLALSLKTDQWHWFQRSGAIAAAAGGWLSVRRLERLGVAGLHQHERTIDGGGYEPMPEEIENDRQLELDIRAMHVGFVMLLVGTLVWAYGDLLGCL